MDSDTLQQPAVIEYISLVIPPLFDTTREELLAFVQNVTLQSQGQSVELAENMPPATAAMAFARLYEVAEEAVLVCSNGDRVLLFDHRLRAMIRPYPLEQRLWLEMLEAKNTGCKVYEVLAPELESTIDLAALWNEGSRLDDPLSQAAAFIQRFARTATAAMMLTLRGEIPLLGLLPAIYLARAYAHTVRYEDGQRNMFLLFS